MQCGIPCKFNCLFMYLYVYTRDFFFSIKPSYVKAISNCNFYHSDVNAQSELGIQVGAYLKRKASKAVMFCI